MIIGLGYKKRSGKDTVAEHLIDHHDFQRAAFADKLKEIAAIMFDWSAGRMLADDQKEVVDEFWGLSPRQALQLLGTEAGRQVFGDDFWVKHVFRKMSHYPEQRHWVISDVRFPNEARAVKDAGGVLWRVDRPGLTSSDTHASETSMDDWQDWDQVIVNDGTLGDLYARVDRLLP